MSTSVHLNISFRDSDRPRPTLRDSSITLRHTKIGTTSLEE